MRIRKSIPRGACSPLEALGVSDEPRTPAPLGSHRRSTFSSLSRRPSRTSRFVQLGGAVLCALSCSCSSQDSSNGSLKTIGGGGAAGTSATSGGSASVGNGGKGGGAPSFAGSSSGISGSASGGTNSGFGFGGSGAFGGAAVGGTGNASGGASGSFGLGGSIGANGGAGGGVAGGASGGSAGGSAQSGCPAAQPAATVSCVPVEGVTCSYGDVTCECTAADETPTQGTWTCDGAAPAGDAGPEDP